MLFKQKSAFCSFFLCILLNVCQAQPPKLVLPVGHTGNITSAQFAMDGKRIVTSSADGSAKLWDVKTGILLADIRIFYSYPNEARTVITRVSPNGKKIIVSSGYTYTGYHMEYSDGSLWDAFTGKCLVKNINSYPSALGFSFFSPDSKKIGSVLDKVVKVFDAENGKLRTTMTGHKGDVTIAEFSHDTKIIISAAKDSTSKIWDALTGKLIKTLTVKGAVFESLQFSLNDKQIISTLRFNDEVKVIIWDAVNGKILSEINNGQDKLHYVQVSPDGNSIVGIFKDSSIKLWNIATGNLIAGLAKQNVLESSIQFSSDSKKFAALSIDNSIKIWNSATGELSTEITGEKYKLRSVHFSPDNKFILAVGDIFIKTWNVSSGQLSTDFLGTHISNAAISSVSNGFLSAAFSSDGKQLAMSYMNGTVKIRDPVNGNLLVVLDGHTKETRKAQFSADGKLIFSFSKDGYDVKIWDLATGVLITSLSGSKGFVQISSVELSPDNKKAAVCKYQSSQVDIWDITTGKISVKLNGGTSAHFSPDGEKIVTVSRDNSAKIWKVSTGDILAELKGHTSGLLSAYFSPDASYIITASAKPLEVKIWDAVTGVFKADLTGISTPEITSMEFTADGKQIAAYSLFETVKLWDVSKGGSLTEFLNHSPEIRIVMKENSRNERILSPQNLNLLAIYEGSISSNKYSPDGKKVITVLISPNILLWDFNSKKLIAELKGHTGSINSAEFSPDSKKLVTASKDNTMKLWDVSTGKCLFTFFPLDSTDYFDQIASGYYQSSPNAAKLLHYVTNDLKVITFEQLDVKYNRPDKVLEAIGNIDTALISMYRNAYYKRIKKLGIDTTAFRDGYSVPEADFVNRDAIAAEQTRETLSLQVKGADKDYKLDRINIWVNEVPVFGQRGFSLRPDNSNSVDKTVAIKLSQGENRIETSVSNVNGTESYRMPLIVNYNPPIKQKEKTYFIGIGIDKFADSKYDLNYSTKDIQDLTLKLKSKFGNDIIIDTLLNEQVSVSNIKALKQKLLQTTVNDKVIISYSGHGLLSNDYDYYLSTYSVNFEKPEEQGLGYDELESLLDSIPARKKLMLIDACHSGEVDKETFQQVQVNQAAMDSNHIVSKGVKIINTDTASKKLGLQNSFELMQNLFVNVGKSTGATIISAASGTEFALENGSLKNGVFTFSVMEAMDKYPKMKISELKRIVGSRVEQLTNGMQKPTSRNEAIAVDWNVW